MASRQGPAGPLTPILGAGKAERGLLDRLDAVIRDPRAEDGERAEHAAETVVLWLRERGCRIAADEVLRELGARPGPSEQLALEAGHG